MSPEQRAKDALAASFNNVLAAAHDSGRGWSEADRDGWGPIADAIGAAVSESALAVDAYFGPGSFARAIAAGPGRR